MRILLQDRTLQPELRQYKNPPSDQRNSIEVLKSCINCHQETKAQADAFKEPSARE
jgi:hypothetical protein